MKPIQTEMTTKEIVKLGRAFENSVPKKKDGVRFFKKDFKIWEFLNSLIEKKS